MRTLMLWICGSLAFSSVHAQSDTAGQCTALVVKKVEGGGATVTTVVVPSGSVRVFPVGAASPNLDVVVPVGAGQSGNLVTADSKYMLIASCTDGELKLQMRSPDGKTREVAAQPMSALDAFEIRVSVIGHTTRDVFNIRRLQIERDEIGPVLDLFKGVPIGDGDFAVITEVRPLESRAAAKGKAALNLADGWLTVSVTQPPLGARTFVVDTGAAQTLVARPFLPVGAAIRPSRVIEHSATGLHTLSQKAQGGGGTISSYLGKAVIPELVAGDIHLRDNLVDVLSGLTLGKDISGVLGLDAMQRADRVAITFPRGKSPGEISFGATPGSSAEPDVELPFSLVSNHIFVRGQINGQPVTFLIDSGSRESYVAPALAMKAGITPAPGSGRAAGLDGTVIETQSGVADRLTLGNRTFPETRLRIASIPVLANFGLQEGGAILGNDFLQRLARLEIDFTHRTVRLFVQHS